MKKKTVKKVSKKITTVVPDDDPTKRPLKASTTKHVVDRPPPGVLPKATKEMRKAQSVCELLMSREGRTAILLRRDGENGVYIPMAPGGLFRYVAPLTSLFKEFEHSSRDPSSPKSLISSDVEHAARCYVTHMTYAGGGNDAIEELGRLIVITDTEKEKIMAKSTTREESRDTDGGGRGKSKTVGGAKKTGAVGRKGTGAAQTFRELIMKGGMTDDQIFAEVRKRHPEVTPDKRGYVGWYRNDLRKKGENPPAAKKGKEEEAPAKKTKGKAA